VAPSVISTAVASGRGWMLAAETSSSIGWSGLLASTVLVVVAVAISWRLALGLERSMVWSCIRAAAQLLVTGWALTLVLRPEASIAWSWLWVVAMVGVAGLTVRNRAPEVPGILPLALGATAAVGAVSLGVIFGFGIFPVEARTVIPLAGMMIGNSMTAVVVAARRVTGELRDKRLEVESRLALGQSWKEASRPYVREAMRTAMIPQIESTKAVGLVFLPGAMTGLILAGVSPVDAVQVQLAIMYLILGSVATSVTVVGLGLTRQLFTPDGRLVRLVRPT
jgi:putative ABC transport system permease protein